MPQEMPRPEKNPAGQENALGLFREEVRRLANGEGDDPDAPTHLRGIDAEKIGPGVRVFYEWVKRNPSMVTAEMIGAMQASANGAERQFLEYLANVLQQQSLG